MLTGKLPFDGETAQESMIMRLTDEPKSLSVMKPDTSWSPEVQAVMNKALQRRSADRYQKAAQFGVALWEAVDHMPKQAAAGATMMIGAADGATAMIAAPPKTRLDSSPALPPALAEAMAPAPRYTGGAPVKSKAPLYAGGGVAIALAALAMIYVSKSTGKAGSTPPVSAEATAPNATPVTLPGGVPAQTSPGTATVPQSTTQKPVNRPASNSTVAAPPPVTPSSSAAVSYASDLDALANTIGDEKSAQAALRRLPEFESKVSLPQDKAAVSFIEASATMVAVGAEKGCRMMKIVRRDQLNAAMKLDLDEALKACGP